jgi:hypothetical protein
MKKVITVASTIALVIGMAFVGASIKVVNKGNANDYPTTDMALGYGMDLLNNPVDQPTAQTLVNNFWSPGEIGYGSEVPGANGSVINTASPCVKIYRGPNENYSNVYANKQTSETNWGFNTATKLNVAYDASGKEDNFYPVINNTVPDPQDPSKSIPDPANDAVLDAMGHASFSANFSDKTEHTTTTTFYQGQGLFKLYDTQLQYEDNGVPVQNSDGTWSCQVQSQDMSPMDMVMANLTDGFKQAEKNLIQPKDLFDKYGEYILGRASYGGNYSLNYVNDSTTDSVQYDASAVVSGGADGWSTVNEQQYDNFQKTTSTGSTITMTGIGGIGVPTMGPEVTDAISSFNNWAMSVYGQGYDHTAYIGYVNESTGSFDYSKAGYYIWSLINPDLVCDSNCYKGNENYGLYSDAKAPYNGTPISYRQYVKDAYWYMLANKGSEEKILPKAPYVKDIFLGSSTSSDTDARNDLQNKMNANPGDAGSVIITGSNRTISPRGTADSADVDAVKGHDNCDVYKWCSPIYTLVGYTLTNDVTKAMTSYNLAVTNGNPKDVSNPYFPYNGNWANVFLDDWKRQDYNDSSPWATLVSGNECSSNIFKKHLGCYASNVGFDTYNHQQFYSLGYVPTKKYFGDVQSFIIPHDITRYDPSQPTTATSNMPITAVGIQNLGNGKDPMGDGGLYPLPTARQSNPNAWSPMPTREPDKYWTSDHINLNSGLSDGNPDTMYLWLRH